MLTPVPAKPVGAQALPALLTRRLSNAATPVMVIGVNTVAPPVAPSRFRHAVLGVHADDRVADEEAQCLGRVVRPCLGR